MSAVTGTSLTSISRNFVRFARLEKAGSLSSFVTRRHIPKDDNFEISNLSASFNLVWSGGGGGGSAHFRWLYIYQNCGEYSVQRTKFSNEPTKVLGFMKVYNYVVGHAVAQLVEALRYKPEGRGFDSRWCHWFFSLT